MKKFSFAALLILCSSAACGDDTSSGAGGAGGEDLSATVVGAGGGTAGCTLGDVLACSCREGGAGSKTCVQDQFGETYFDQCKDESGPC